MKGRFGSKVTVACIIFFSCLSMHARSLQDAYSAYLEKRQARSGNQSRRLMNASAPKARSYDLLVENVTDDLLDRIRALGGEIKSTRVAMNHVRIVIGEDKIDVVKAWSQVKSVALSTFGRPNKIDTSEGDTAHRADEARRLWNVDGTGVKVGVISDSVRYLSDVQDSGDLPHVEVLPGRDGVLSAVEVAQYEQEGRSPDLGEGTAMLELVYDIAPGAKLYFASGAGGYLDMADAVDALVEAGCDIIVDDMSFDDEPVFRDSALAQAVNRAADRGVIYFSCSINRGNKYSGTSCVYEGDFSPEYEGGVLNLDGVDYVAHRFGSLAGQQECRIYGNALESSVPDFLFLVENAPDKASSQGYRLCLYDHSSGEFVSRNWNASNTDAIFAIPSWGVSSGSLTNCDIYVIRPVTAENRYFRIMAAGGILQYGTSGSTFGHCAAEKAITVAAVSGASGAVFQGKEKIRIFSGDGPRKMFFKNDGTRYTQSLLSDGGITLVKPEFAAADRVSTATPAVYKGVRCFRPFNGTSAAAPHLAAIGALMLQVNPAMTRNEMVAIMKASTFGDGAWDETYGYGIVDAYTAVMKAKESMRPPNDDFGNASWIYGESGSSWGTNTYATADWRGSDLISFNGIWWAWKATFSGYMTFDTRASTFENKIAVYEGENLESATKLDFAFSSRGAAAGAAVTVKVTKGETYHILIESWGDEKGEARLNWFKPPFFGPDFCFAAPDGWPDGAYLSKESRGAKYSEFSATDTVYFNSNIINIGNDSVTNECRTLYEILDSQNSVVEFWYDRESLFQARNASVVLNKFDNLAVGSYSLRCTVDPDGKVPDGDRSNNVATVPFVKTAPTSLAQPNIWSGMENNGVIMLLWSAVSGAEHYKIYRSRSATMPDSDKVYATVTGGFTQFADQTFFANKTYNYWLVAVAGNVESAPSACKSVQTTHVGAGGTGPEETVDGGDPTGNFRLNATLSSDGKVVLEWSPYNYAIKYYIRRSDEPVLTGASTIGTVSRDYSITKHTFTNDISTSVGTTFYYWVEARSGTSVQGVSDRVEVTFVPAKPESNIGFYAHAAYGWLQPVFLCATNNNQESRAYRPQYAFESGSPLYLNISFANFDTEKSVTIDNMAVGLGDENGNPFAVSDVDMGYTLGPLNFLTLYNGDMAQKINGIAPGNYVFAVYLDPDDRIGDPDPSDNRWLSWFAIKASGISLNEALDCDDLDFTAYGDTPPFVQTSESIVGDSCVQFGPQEMNSQSSLLYAEVDGPGTLSFNWKAASVDMKAWLELWIDGSFTNWLWGTDAGWSQVTLNLGEGRHQLIWDLVTEGYGMGVFSGGWLDAVQWKRDEPICDMGFYTPASYGWLLPVCLSSTELATYEYSQKTSFVSSDRFYLHIAVANYQSTVASADLKTISLLLMDESGNVVERQMLKYDFFSLESKKWNEIRNIDITTYLKDKPIGRYKLLLELDPQNALNDPDRSNNTKEIWLEIKEESVSIFVAGGTLEVPCSWMGRYDDFKSLYGDDFASALEKKSGKHDAAGHEMYVWQDYVAGTDPTDSNDVFRAFISFTNGMPCINWTPDLNANGATVRTYTIEGRESISYGAWEHPTNSTHRFFRVKVDIP